MYAQMGQEDVQSLRIGGCNIIRLEALIAAMLSGNVGVLSASRCFAMMQSSCGPPSISGYSCVATSTDTQMALDMFHMKRLSSIP